VILLGASNLTLGWRPLLRALQATVHGPLDIRVSLGLGRSYVGSSVFMFRKLPGIVNCGLWDNLPATDTGPPLVLVTDLGNDIAFMRSPDTIFQSVMECIRRIRNWRADARIVMTGLPLCSLNSLEPARFLIARSVLFPRCRMSFPEILARSETLNQVAQQFAQQHNIPWVIPQAEWYRADPIHVIRPLREQVFRQFFSHWNLQLPKEKELQVLPVAGLPASAMRTICGFQRRVPQPVFEAPELVVSAW
jgi:hypothetical protein